MSQCLTYQPEGEQAPNYENCKLRDLSIYTYGLTFLVDLLLCIASIVCVCV